MVINNLKAIYNNLKAFFVNIKVRSNYPTASKICKKKNCPAGHFAYEPHLCSQNQRLK